MARKKFISPIANPDLLPKGLRSPVSQQSQQEFAEKPNVDHDDDDNNNSTIVSTEEEEEPEGEEVEKSDNTDDQKEGEEEQNNESSTHPTTVATKDNDNEEQQSNEHVMKDDNDVPETATSSAPEIDSTTNQMENDHDDNNNNDEKSEGNDNTATMETEEQGENEESETMNASTGDDATHVPQEEGGGIEFEDEEDDIPAKKKSKKSKKSSSKKRKRKDDDSEDEDFEQEPEVESDEEEGNADEDESYDNSKEKRKQSKRASKKRKTSSAEDSEGKKSKKKRKVIEGAEGVLGDEEDEGYDASEGNENGGGSKTSKGVSEQFQEILNEIKPRRHHAGQLSEIDDEAAKISEDLLFRMQQAAEEDRENLKNQQPAMAKIQMLSEVQRTASKVYLQQPLLERGFLSVLADWLKLLPNRQLPNVNLRNIVLDILVQLPIQGDKRVLTKRQREEDAEDDFGITKDLLEKSRAIAKCVKMLSTHPKETVENKKKAKGLVERWSRLYYELPDDYSRYAPVPEPEGYTRNSSSSRPKKMSARPRLSEEEEAKIKSSTRARIPQKVNFDFQKRPQNKIDSKGKDIAPPPSVGASSVTSFASPTQRRLAKKFFEMKRR